MEVWPFLVTRNRRLDYRTVIAPQFLIEAGAAGVLARLAGGEIGSRPSTKVWEGSPAGDLTLYYHVTQAHLNDKLLTDTHGRRVALVEGAIVKGKFHDKVFRPELLDRVHSAVAEVFETFWTGELPLLEASQPLSSGIDDIKGIHDVKSSGTLVETHGEQSKMSGWVLKTHPDETSGKFSRNRKFRSDWLRIALATGTCVISIIALGLIRQVRLIGSVQSRLQNKFDSLSARVDTLERVVKPRSPQEQHRVSNRGTHRKMEEK